MTISTRTLAEREHEEELSEWQRQLRHEQKLDNAGFHGDEDVPLFLGEMEDELHAHDYGDPRWFTARRRYIGAPVAEAPVEIAAPAVERDVIETNWVDWMDE